MKDIKDSDPQTVEQQPPTDETLRELIVALSSTIQQVKQMYIKVPKFDLLKFIRLILLGVLLGVFLVWYAQRHMNLPGTTVINAGMAFVPQDGVTILTWGNSSQSFIDCINSPSLDSRGNALPTKECKLIIHNISNS